MAQDEQSPLEAPAAGTPASTTPEPAAVPAEPQPAPLPTAAATAPAPAAAVQAAAEPPAAAAPAAPGFFGRLAASARRNPSRTALWTILILLLVVGFVWPNVPAPHVALGGEQALPSGPRLLTNSLLTTLLVDIILIVVALLTSARMNLVPSGLQNGMEMVIEYFWGLAEQIAGKAARNYFPWIMTIFLLVIVSNWTGLIPGVGSIGWEHHDTHSTEAEAAAPSTGGSRYGAAQLAMANGNLILLSPEAAAAQAEDAAAEAEAHFIPMFRAPSADLNLTFALAIATMVMVQVWGVRALGGSYFRKFFNASGKGFMRGINAFVGILELISEVSRILSFGFRLFGNIFAGEIVLATMAFLGAFLLPVPFYVLEMFVGFVQALVFAMLALVFFSMATASHGEHHEEHAAAH